MSEIVTPTQVKVATFATKRNANDERIKKDEEELKLLEEEQAGSSSNEEASSQEDNEEPTSAEEKTFKKRYGDLRRHSQKQQVELQNQIDELRSQLEQSTKKQIKLPKSEEEINNWASQYPEVYKIIETIAIKKSTETASGIEERLKRVDEMERNAKREKAEVELMQLHPDFDEIRDDDAFHEWVEEQPKWVQQALYENDTDARAAAKAISLYKYEKGITSSKPKKADKGAASAVGTRGSKSVPTNDSTEGLVYESQVAKMSDKEFEQRYDEIMTARSNGKFVYDITQAAR